MTDSEIINNFLVLTIPDEHPAIYQYVAGGHRSKETAVNNLLLMCDEIFMPPYSQGHVRTVIRKFLKTKKDLHGEGLIKIKPIY